MADLRRLARVFVNVCCVFAFLVPGWRHHSRSGQAVVSGLPMHRFRLRCGVPPSCVCVRGSLAWFMGPWHTALFGPHLCSLEWLSHVLVVVDPPGWFSTDGGQMWPCSRAPGEHAPQTVRRERESALRKRKNKTRFQAASLKATSLQAAVAQKVLICSLEFL